MPRINNAQNFRGQLFATQTWVNSELAKYLLAQNFKCVVSINGKQGELKTGDFVTGSKYITVSEDGQVSLVVDGSVVTGNEGLVTGGQVADAIATAVNGKAIGVESIDGEDGVLTTGDYLSMVGKVLTLTVDGEIKENNTGLVTGGVVYKEIARLDGKINAIDTGVLSIAGVKGDLTLDNYLEMSGQQITVKVDTVVTEDSSKLITSGAVYTAIEDAIEAAKKYVDDAKYVKWSETTTTVGETGVDTAIPTQKAVRTAINAMKSAIDGEKLGLVDGVATDVVDVEGTTNKKVDVLVDGVTIKVGDDNKLATLLTMKKIETVSGYAASYQLQDGDNKPVGDTINILKDQFLKSADVVWSESATTMVNESADKKDEAKYAFLKLVMYVFDGDSEAPTQAPVYVPVNELFQSYEAGTGIKIASNTISLDVEYVQGLINNSDDALKGKVQTALDTLADNVEDEIDEVAGDLATKTTNAINAVDTAVAAFKDTVNTALSTTATNVNTAVSDFKTSVDTALGNVNTAVSGFETSVNTALSTTVGSVNTAVSGFKTSVDTALTNVNNAFAGSYVITRVSFTFGEAVQGVRTATVEGEVMATYQDNKLAYPQVEINGGNSTISAEFGDQPTGTWSALVAKPFVSAEITTTYAGATADTAEFTEATVTTTYANATAGTSTYNSAQANITAKAADELNVTIAE